MEEEQACPKCALGWPHVRPVGFADGDHWCARYLCPRCQTRWRVPVRAWTTVQRVSWYRDHVLRGGAKRGDAPWKV